MIIYINNNGATSLNGYLSPTVIAIRMHPGDSIAFKHLHNRGVRKGLFTPSGSVTASGRVTLIYTCAIHTKRQRQHHPNPIQSIDADADANA